MKYVIACLLFISLLISAAAADEKTTFPLKSTRNRSLVDVKIDNLIIPDILLDTGFGFDGLMIYHL